MSIDVNPIPPTMTRKWPPAKAVVTAVVTAAVAVLAIGIGMFFLSIAKNSAESVQVDLTNNQSYRDGQEAGLRLATEHPGYRYKEVKGSCSRLAGGGMMSGAFTAGCLDGWKGMTP